ncbi:MAG TPA: hypothetical protein VL947_07465, partial [Cytophagales bacterium]|nr:hypothetical protein [Cytophagales bacterium]
NVSLMPDYAGATLHEGPAPEEGKQLPNEPHTLHAPSKISFVLPQSPQVMEALVHYGTMTDYYAVSTYNASIGGYGLEFIAPISAKPTILGVYETKDKAEEVKERLIHKLSLMAEKSLGFHVVEHILLRPSVETLYQLQMRVSTKVTLKSLYKDSYSNQKLLYMDAVIYGAQKQNYVVRSLVKNGMHNHVVFLQDDFQNDLLQLHILPPFKTSHEAENYIAQELIPFFQLLALEKLEIPAQVQIKANKISTTALDDKPINSEGFYNARLTLLFPAWVLRFNDPDFRTLLTHVLVKCVPAHIKTELLWLTKSQMMDFERLFKKWMELKAEVTSLPIPASPHGKVQRARQRKDHYKSLIKKRQLDVYANEIKVRFLNSQTP